MTLDLDPIGIGRLVQRAEGFQRWASAGHAGPRMGLVIPYRDREEHLNRLLPHLASFFQHDLANRDIRPLVVVAEQADHLKFNRGFCCNAGALAVLDHCDYLCFHDVDYLPLWADYRSSPSPSRIIWWGMHRRPLRVADPTRWVRGSSKTLGAVAVIGKDLFVAVNGFSNQYRGWGFEDDDLQNRCAANGRPPEHRNGAFLALDHDHAGLTETGQKNADWLDNLARFEPAKERYWSSRTFDEGLGTIKVNNAEARFEDWQGLYDETCLTVCRLRVAQRP